MTIGSRTSGQKDLFPAVRWILPSIGDLIFIALLGLLAFTTLSVRLLGDAGIGWHIRTGQLILATHSVPRLDTFSSSVAGHPWFAWEWLYDLLAGWLDRVAGLNGVVLFTALVIALTFSWTYFLLLRRGTNFFVALVLVMLAASAAMIHFFARPHVLSWLFTVAWFAILDSYETKSAGSPNSSSRRWRLWLLPALMLVWVNVHGGFLLGFALLAIYWLSAVWQYFRSTDNRFDEALGKITSAKRARDLALVSAACALATLANPYGWRLHVHVYRYLSNRFLMDHIDEFQSPNFHGVAQKCFAGLLMLALVAFATKDRERGPIRTCQALIGLFAVYSALFASRNIPVSALLLILVIGPRLSSGLRELASDLARRRMFSRPLAAPRHFVERMQLIETTLHGHVWPMAAIVVTCWIAFHGGSFGSRPLMNAHFDAKRFPVAAVNYLARGNTQLQPPNRTSDAGPVFVPDFWGGYLIYRLAPQIKVAVDDRHDLYGEEFLKSYLKMMHVEPGWGEFLVQHPVRYILVPKDSALASILTETPSWQPIYNDEVAIIFAPVAR